MRDGIHGAAAAGSKRRLLSRATRDMQTTIIGIDCAAQPNKVGLALGISSPEGVKVQCARVGGRKPADHPLKIATDWATETKGRLLFALDAPLGWPAPLAEELPRHRAGEEIKRDANQLFQRVTDQYIRARLRQRPLDVGADRIARTAMAALRLLGGLRESLGTELPMVWDPQFEGRGVIEVYPAATLVAHGIVPKAAAPPEVIAELLSNLRRRMEVPVALTGQVVKRDAVDAMTCVLAAHDFLRGQAMPPETPLHRERARTEGWIWARTRL